MSLARSLTGLLYRPYTCTVIQRIATVKCCRQQQNQIITLPRWVSTGITNHSESSDGAVNGGDKVDTEPSTSPGLPEYDSEKVDSQLAVAKEALETDAAIRARQTTVKKAFVFPDVERQPGEYFPTERIRDLYVEGVRFDDLPTVHIVATPQNTKGGAYLSDGNAVTYQSGGRVGFKNTKKKTAVCGQTVGFAIGLDLIKKGYTNTRVVLKGFGQGRLSSMKGLQLAGVNIISITDTTYPNVTTRPKGKRSL